MEYNSSSIDQLYQSHLNEEKIRISRIMCLLGIILYTFFAIVDYYMFSASLVNILLIRGFTIIILVSVFAYSHHKSFTEQYDFLFLSIYILAAAGIEAMSFIASPANHIANIYFSGLILIIMSIFTWSYLDIRNALLASAIIIASHLFLDLQKATHISDLLINTSFLTIATIIGFISQSIRDNYLKENFILQQTLKDSIKEKTNEANHDELTGLPNRRCIKAILKDLLKKSEQKKNKTLVILFIDLNGFKQINDTYGHAIGDEILSIVAKRLKLSIRGNDSVARLGGDEYLIGLLVKKNHILSTQKIAEKIENLIAAPIRVNDLKLNVTASIGIAIYPNHGITIDKLIDYADREMYLTKHGAKRTINTQELMIKPTNQTKTVLSIVQT